MSTTADQIISLVRNPTNDRQHEFEGDHGLVLARPGLSSSRFLLMYTQELLEELTAILEVKCDGAVLAHDVQRGVVHIACFGRRSSVRAKRNHRICFDLLRALNAVLADRYEIRSMTYRHDEPDFRAFVLASTADWAAAERSEDLSNQFERIGPKSGFMLDRFPWVAVLSLERLAFALMGLLATIMAWRALRRR